MVAERETEKIKCINKLQWFVREIVPLQPIQERNM